MVLFRIKIKEKSFSLNLMEEEQVTIHKEENNAIFWLENYTKIINNAHKSRRTIQKKNHH